MTPHDERLLEAVVRVENISGDIAEIKDSMKEMARAVSRLAVIEERQSTDRSALDRAFNGLIDHDRRLKVLEKAAPMQELTSSWVQKAVWLVVTAVITAGLTWIIVDRKEMQQVRTTQTTTTEVKR